jgi:hypothetical protein
MRGDLEAAATGDPRNSEVWDFMAFLADQAADFDRLEMVLKSLARASFRRSAAWIGRLGSQYSEMAGQPGIETFPRVDPVQGSAAETKNKIPALFGQGDSAVPERITRGRELEVRLLCARCGGRLMAAFPCQCPWRTPQLRKRPWGWTSGLKPL